MESELGSMHVPEVVIVIFPHIYVIQTIITFKRLAINRYKFYNC